MSEKTEKTDAYHNTTSWVDFKMSSNGTSGDIRRSAAEIRTKVSEERKIFADTSIFDGGSKKYLSK